ncbi:MAG TPA: exodeoxyribonuclease VII small subunit [Xanthomonadales bacterium]|nr:exodeoxyribonuclease VII small subunit [Xanthomonadales bacterium]
MSPAPSPEPDDNPIAGFEKSLDELESLVRKMEAGDLSLDETLSSYERGIGLYRRCRQALEQAELRVKLLSDAADPDTAEDFPLDER